MNPWTKVLNQIWYYLESGPKSEPVRTAFPPANRFRYGPDAHEPKIPFNSRQPVLIVDQAGGKIDLDYSPMYLRVTEEYQISIWSDSPDLGKINDLRLKILAAIESGLPDLGLADVLDVKIKAGRVTSGSMDKAELDSTGRSIPFRRELKKYQTRAVLLELSVTFLIARSEL